MENCVHVGSESGFYSQVAVMVLLISAVLMVSHLKTLSTKTSVLVDGYGWVWTRAGERERAESHVVGGFFRKNHSLSASFKVVES